MDEADTLDWPDAPCRRGRKQGKARGLGRGSGVHPVSPSLSLAWPGSLWHFGSGQGGKVGQVERLGIRWGHLDQSNT